jgi:opine dehydrogenase
MAEDIGIGLALLVSVARWARVKVPTAEGLLQLGSIAAGQNFLTTGRTMASLGLKRLKRLELVGVLGRGF